LKRPPIGFTREQWAAFEDEGILVIENAIDQDSVRRYLEAILDVRRIQGGSKPRIKNLVEHDHRFADLIDHPRHVGFAYDLYGEQLKLHSSDGFVRPPGDTEINRWHIDGPRAVPYSSFSTKPLCIKIGYWLTDLPEERMGNFTFVRGSHSVKYSEAYDTRSDQPGQEALRCKSGTMTIVNTSLWHMVQENLSEATRFNIFLTYSPSWISSGGHSNLDRQWLSSLTREQKIIMRGYVDPSHQAKPPSSEFPLFLDRDTGLDSDKGMYLDHVKLSRRRRITSVEKF
jgi:ectoine hydroxylase-related dioxygenase (phytanoyl-CoA dioxygenase family)